METSSYDDPMFSEYSSEAVLNPMGPKAIPHHHFVTSSHHHHHHHHAQPIMNGDMNQHTRLPGISEIQQVLPSNSPKIDGGHYKTLDYSHVKLETDSFSSNGKIDYHNGNNAAKLDSYSSPSSGGHQQKLEYTSNGQYSPSSGKIMEFSTVTGQQHIEQHIQLYHQPQSLDGNQQTALLNGNDGNFKRKSDENLNNLSGSPTPTTIINSSISPSDGSSTASLNKKPTLEKKKNDPNGVKKKKTR